MNIAPDCLRINGQRVCVERINPPVPVNCYDYSATLADYDEGGPIGYGSTAAEAVADLRQQVEDDE